MREVLNVTEGIKTGIIVLMIMAALYFIGVGIGKWHRHSVEVTKKNKERMTEIVDTVKTKGLKHYADKIWHGTQEEAK